MGRGRRRRDGGRPDAGAAAPKGRGPRRPAPGGVQPNAPGRGENRPEPSLVVASFLGRESEWVDPSTGEVRPPVKVGFIEYPDGGGELYGIVNRVRSGRSTDAGLREWRTHQREVRELGQLKANERAEERRRAREERSASECARRARSNVRRLCRSYGLRYMVTLTFPGAGVHDYDRALQLVQDFIHDHGEALHCGREWLAVPERHPGGHGWHWHVLVPERFTKPGLKALRTGWTEFLRRRGMPPSGGARFVRIDVKRFGDAERAAMYAAKYVGKAFESGEREKGRKRYLRPTRLAVEVGQGSAGSLAEVRDAINEIGARTSFSSSDAKEWQGPPMVWATW